MWKLKISIQLQHYVILIKKRTIYQITNETYLTCGCLYGPFREPLPPQQVSYQHREEQIFMFFYLYHVNRFWAGPVTILLAMFAMAKWTREKTVTGVQLLIAFLGHLVFFVRFNTPCLISFYSEIKSSHT